uniref:Uncharacterized protein n=1 Tax=Anguilla anguilla TaxID=7936 RepID=A0A0E9TPF2_ANGAN
MVRGTKWRHLHLAEQKPKAAGALRVQRSQGKKVAKLKS